MFGVALGLFYVIKLIHFYTAILFIRVLLTWFIPYQNWFKPPLSYLAAITDPLLNRFRGIIPPIGAIDLSPILLFIMLNVIADYLIPMLIRMIGF